MIDYLTITFFLDENDMRIQDINVGGVIKGNKVALLHMAKQGKSGVIINTSSIGGRYYHLVLFMYYENEDSK